MSVRPAAFAGIAFVVLFAPLPHRAPILTKYRVESRNETTVDLSGFGQPALQQNIRLVSWISVSLRDSAGGRVLDVVVDSMKYDGDVAQVSQATADSAKGGGVRGFVDGQGRVKGLTPRPADNVFLSDVQGVIHSLFPRVKPGAKAGDGWSDTVEVSNTSNGANLKSKFLIDYTAAGMRTVAGAPALMLNATSAASIGGTMENPAAGTMEVEGTIKGKSETLVSTEGRYLGGSSSSTSDQVLKSPMIPAPVPVKVIRHVTVTLLP